jgi:hypothetical protein
MMAFDMTKHERLLKKLRLAIRNNNGDEEIVRIIAAILQLASGRG